jgi:transposase-like protein
MSSDPPDPSRPAPRGRSKATPEQRAEAVDRVRGGESMASVARTTGVHPSTVRRWVREAAEADGTPSEVEAGAAQTGTQTTKEATKEATNEVTNQAPTETPREPPDHPPETPVETPAATTDGPGTVDPDRVLPLVHRIRSTHRYVTVVVAWVAMLGVSAVLPGPGAFRGFLQLGHLLGLAVAVGAVAVIDWHGLLWMGRKRDLRETARIAAAVTPLIWAGLLVLGVTGALLKPDLTAPLAWVKMVAVLVLALNGVAASETRQVLRRTVEGVGLEDLPRALATRLLASAAASQLAWLTAIVIGLTTQAARS